MLGQRELKCSVTESKKVWRKFSTGPDMQCSIKTIQMTQHVKTSDQINTAVAELGPAQPQLVSHSVIFFKGRSAKLLSVSK